MIRDFLRVALIDNLTKKGKWPWYYIRIFEANHKYNKYKGNAAFTCNQFLRTWQHDANFCLKTGNYLILY